MVTPLHSSLGDRARIPLKIMIYAYIYTHTHTHNHNNDEDKAIYLDRKDILDILLNVKASFKKTQRACSTCVKNRKQNQTI